MKPLPILLEEVFILKHWKINDEINFPIKNGDLFFVFSQIIIRIGYIFHHFYTIRKVFAKS
jgi:hypothetical protein